MATLLFLVHRLPFPPNKGDKVRSYHLLKHLMARHRVFLGTFVDDPDDEQHLATVRSLCTGLHAVRLDPRKARIRSLRGLASGEPLSVAYYADAELREWVARTAETESIDASVVFSSAMAPYAQALPHVPMLVDFVDVDSAKWAQYATTRRWPLSWVYRREGRRLLAHECEVALASQRSFFVTSKEVALFRALAPECASRVEAMNNGVDAEFFAPQPDRACPYPVGVTAILFTGAMDYWPNVDAVRWFATEMLPALRTTRPQLRFFIVGRNPAAGVLALASDAVVVTGTVPDVRPWLQHAAVVVAPLRLARGVQNKVLEAMAMGRPVVAAGDCVESIEAVPGTEVLAANDVAGYVAAVESLLAVPGRADAIGRAGQRRVRQQFSWDAHLARVDRHLDAAAAPSAAEALA